MKIFLTGGTGFIGSHFINAALMAGHEIRAIRRAGSHPRVDLVEEPEWIERDLETLDDVDLRGCDALVHLAAESTNPPYATFERCFHGNVTMGIRLAQAAFRANVRAWIVAGSCFEYGKAGGAYENIPASCPLEPVGSYPTSKAAASIAFMGLAQTLGVSLFIGRPFQVFGEGEHPSRLWPSLKRAAESGDDFPMTKGEQIRDFVPVSTVAAAFVRALQAMPEHGAFRVENIGTGQPKTVRAFAEAWWAKWNAKGRLLIGALPYRENEVMRYVPALPQ